MVSGVDFVAINVPRGGMDVARAFYGEVLGLAVDDPTDPTWRQYDTGNVTLCVVADDHPVDPADLRRHGGGGSTIALAVDDIAGLLGCLRAGGFEVRFGPTEHRPCVIAGIRDPFGHDLYLHQRKDGTAG